MLVGVVDLFGQREADVPSLLSVESVFGCEELLQPSSQQMHHLNCVFPFLFLYSFADFLDLAPSDTPPASSASSLHRLHFLELVQVILPQQLPHLLLPALCIFLDLL